MKAKSRLWQSLNFSSPSATLVFGHTGGGCERLFIDKKSGNIVARCDHTNSERVSGRAILFFFILYKMGKQPKGNLEKLKEKKALLVAGPRAGPGELV